MRTTPLLFFYLLLCCQTTESLSDKRVILGGNVTLDCELDNKDIYWLFMKPPESLVLILRTFSSESTLALFYDQRLKSKYSLKQLSRLIIRNITKEELGIYYCARVNTKGLNFSNGTKLYTTETVHQNEREENDQQQHMQHNTTTTHLALTLTSISLNVLLFITIIGLSRKSGKPYQNVKEKQFDDLNTEEFTEVEFCLYE